MNKKDKEDRKAVIVMSVALVLVIYTTIHFIFELCQELPQ
jgi:hypothetical protein